MVLKKNLIIALSLISNIICYAQKKSPPPAADSAIIITIRGIVEKGVETSCILLKTKNNTIYNLVNIQTTVKFGTCLKVTGYIKKDAPTTCMQGTVFYVVSYCPCNKKSKPKYQRDELPKEKINKLN